MAIFASCPPSLKVVLIFFAIITLSKKPNICDKSERWFKLYRLLPDLPGFLVGSLTKKYSKG